MAPGTIRNLIWKRELKKNIHYIKPTPRKILFIWKAVENWMHANSVGVEKYEPNHQKSLIDI
jgi:hypothetical protein